MEPNVVDHTSMWSLISNASIVVQLVMLTLVAASVSILDHDFPAR